MAKTKTRKTRKMNKARYQDSYESRDSGGSSYKGFLDWSKTKLSHKRFEPKGKLVKMNIVPYEVKSKNHPLVRKGVIEVGDLDYVLDIWVHQFVNGKEDVVCPKKNYGKPCPICDQISAYYDAGEDDKARDLKASRRVVYNVQPVVKGEAAGQLEVFSVSHYLFEKELIEEARECSDGEDIVDFADIESGKLIKFRVGEEQLGKNTMTVYKAFDFLDREEELDEALIDQAISFDDLLVVHTAEEIQAILDDADAEEDEEEEDEPKKSSKKKPSKKSEPEEEEEDEEEEDEPEEEEEEDDEEEEEEPTKKSTKKPPAKKKAEPEPEEDEEEEEPEEEEEDEEEEPPKKASTKKASTKKASTKKAPSKKSGGKGKCPHGHTFGKDNDAHDECNRCDVWDECFEASEG